MAHTYVNTRVCKHATNKDKQARYQAEIRELSGGLLDACLAAFSLSETNKI